MHRKKDPQSSNCQQETFHHQLRRACIGSDLSGCSVQSCRLGLLPGILGHPGAEAGRANHFLFYNSQQLYSLNTDIWLAAASFLTFSKRYQFWEDQLFTEKSRNAHRLFALIWLTRRRVLRNYGWPWREEERRKMQDPGTGNLQPLQRS